MGTNWKEHYFSTPEEIADKLAEWMRVEVCIHASLPNIQDKWLLSSALQKLVRRGRAEEAVAVALKLHAVDPRYLRRRLPIIAIEDIGIGDLAICVVVFAVCSAAAWWREPADRSIAALVSLLARATKSRAACDALCLGETHSHTPAMMPELLDAPTQDLVEISSSSRGSLIERVNALRTLGGITVRVGGFYRQLSRWDACSLDRVAARLELPPLVRWLMARNPRTGGLAAMLPISVEVNAGAVVAAGGDYPNSLEFVEGVPLCAVDMFSETGRSCLREWVSGSDRLKGFLARHVHGGTPARLLHMGLFHVESSILGRFLTAPASRRLTSETEEEEMRHLGMADPSHRVELREILTAESGDLAKIRRRRLLELGSSPLTGEQLHLGLES